MSLPAPHSGEKQALEARRQHGLADAGPLDVLDAAENRFDVPVLVDRFGDDKIAGVLLRRAGGDRFVGVNADHHTIRQRFTLAHELGHLHMGHQARVELTSDLFGSTNNAEEVEANYFAAEFLAPRAIVRAWLEERELVDAAAEASTIAQLALEFGIALPSACYRLERAGVISAATKRRLVSEVNVNAATLVRIHASHRFSDSLQSIWQRDVYPRVPRQTAAYAERARAAELIDDEQYMAIVHSPAELDFNDWLT